MVDYPSKASQSRVGTLPYINVQRFRGGLVFNAHRLVYHSTLGLRGIKKKKKIKGETDRGWDGAPNPETSTLRRVRMWRVYGLRFRVEGLLWKNLKRIKDFCLKTKARIWH